jgi:putative membrane protein
MHIVIAWLINAIALFVLPYVFPWVTVDSMLTALLAALVLGLVNALVRPLLILLTLPATILTLGLFIFVINGLLFWMVGSWFEGFHVSGFWSGFFGAIVYSLISMAISALVMPRPAPPPERQ